MLYCKLSLYLCNLLEESGEYRSAIQTVRASVSKVVEAREERLRRCIDYTENVRTPMYITVDNGRVGETERRIQERFDIEAAEWVSKLLSHEKGAGGPSVFSMAVMRRERDRERREAGKPPLEEDEVDEEEYEVYKCAEELRSKGLFERGIEEGEWRSYDLARRSKNRMYFNEVDCALNSLHIDLLCVLYRNEIKLGLEMQLIKNQTNKLLATQGVTALNKDTKGLG